MGLQSITGLFVPVPGNIEFYGASSYVTLDAQNEAYAAIFQIPKTGTLTDVAFALGTVTTGSDYTLRIETVDTTTGFPTGSLYDASGTGSGTIADGDDNTIESCQINGGTGITVTKGNVVAVVIAMTSASPNLRINYQPSGIAYGFPYSCNYIGAPAWADAAGRPNVALNIGGWCSCGASPFCQVFTNEAIALGYERGILMNFPFKCRITGASVYVSTYGVDIKLVIYSDPTGATPVAELTSDTFYGERAGGNVARINHYLFNSTFTPTINTNYVLALQAVQANPYLYYWSYPNNTYAAAYPMGSAMTWYGRNGTSGAFSETNTRVPCLFPLVDQLDDGASTGGGGLPILGGSVIR